MRDTSEVPGEIRTDVPTSARGYNWLLGGKDNYEVDRQTVLHMLQAFPSCLFLSVGHHLLDEPDPRGVLHGLMDRTAPGSHLAFSQVVSDDPERGAQQSAAFQAAGIPWRTRTPAEVGALLAGLEPVEPGLVNLVDWRPMDLQPPLAPIPPQIAHYEGASRRDPVIYEYGGVLRKR